MTLIVRFSLFYWKDFVHVWNLRSRKVEKYSLQRFLKAGSGLGSFIGYQCSTGMAKQRKDGSFREMKVFLQKEDISGVQVVSFLIKAGPDKSTAQLPATSNFGRKESSFCERKVWSTKGKFGLWKKVFSERRFCLWKEGFIFLYSFALAYICYKMNKLRNDFLSTKGRFLSTKV